MLVNDEKRDFMRLVADTDVTITRASSGEVMTARLINLSPSGCAFRTDKVFEVGEELDVLVPSPSAKFESLQRAGHVARRDQSGVEHLVGVEFTPEQG